MIMLFFACMIYSSLQAKYTNSTIRLDQANRNIHVCDHNHLMSILNKDGYLTKSLASSSRHVRADVKLDQPIRVVFNFDYVDDPSKDNGACKKENVPITWGGASFTCTEDDLITETKVNYIKKTFENVGKFLQDTLKVHPTGPFRLTQLGTFPSGYPQPESKEDINADLYLFIFARPFGGSKSPILASASSISYDATSNGRPYAGFVHVNFATLKTSSEGESQTSKSRDFFETALHEITHALGFSEPLYKEFYNKKTGDKYGDDLPFYKCYNNSYKNQRFKILATPKLHEVTAKMFGQETLDLINAKTQETSCPIGAIIEDEGGDGTAGSHFELLTHMNEIMVGMTIGHRSSISVLTLAFLEDTGWYSVDYSKAEPYYYGNYQANYQRKKENKPYTNFLTGPPQLVFPDHYIYHKGDIETRCSFDHRSFGFFPLEEFKCPGDILCDKAAYIDPLGTDTKTSNSLTNNVPIVYPYKVCNTMDLDENLKNSNDEDAFCVPMAKSNTKIDRGLCYKMSCNENELTVYVGDQSGKCPKKDAEVTINSVTITCPDPNVICGILNYQKDLPKPSDPSGGEGNPSGGEGNPSGGEGKPSGGEEKPSGGEGNPSGGEGKPGDNSGQGNGNSNPGKTAGIVIGVILGIAVIVGVIVFVMIYLRRKADNENNEATTA